MLTPHLDLLIKQVLEGVGGLRYYEMVYQWSRKRSQLLVRR